MTFKEAVLQWNSEETHPHRPKAVQQFIERADANPRMWHIAEHLFLAKYEHMTGTVVTGTPDWGKILNWIRANGPVLLKILMSVLSIIALL